jgi:hypothetical protein
MGKKMNGRLLATGVTVAFLVLPAYAEDPSDRFQPASPFQMSKGKEVGRPMGGQQKAPKSAAGRKADEAAYKAALEKIPNADRKYDPWADVRK